MKIAKILALILATLMAVATLASCSTLPEEAFDENGRFDYMNSNMKKYIAIDKKDYKNTSATIEKKLEDSEEGLRAYIAMLCEENGKSSGTKIVDRPIKEGDTVALRYEGWLDGKKFDGGSNMDAKTAHSLKIGSGTFIPGFEEGLIGLIPNQNSKVNPYDLHVTFPTDYYSPDLAGKAVIFKVYIEYIDDIAPAEYTEEFITNTLKYTTNDKDVKASFEKYLKEEVIPSVRRSEILTQLWESLMDNAVVKKYPQTEVRYYYDQYIEEYEYYKDYYEKNQSMTFESFGDFVAKYLGLDSGTDWMAVTTENAETDVTQNLIFHYIAQVENIIVTDTDYQDSITYYVNYYNSYGYNVTATDIEKNMGVRFLKEHALFENVQDFLVDNCNVSYE